MQLLCTVLNSLCINIHAQFWKSFWLSAACWTRWSSYLFHAWSILTLWNRFPYWMLSFKGVNTIFFARLIWIAFLFLLHYSLSLRYGYQNQFEAILWCNLSHNAFLPSPSKLYWTRITTVIKRTFTQTFLHLPNGISDCTELSISCIYPLPWSQAGEYDSPGYKISFCEKRFKTGSSHSSSNNWITLSKLHL